MTLFKSNRLASPILQLTLVYLLIYTFVFAKGQLLIRKRVSTDNCERLPPRSNSTNHEEHNKSPRESNPADVIQKLLLTGIRSLPFETHNISAIMILGNTGSGKTTMSLTINFLVRYHERLTNQLKTLTEMNSEVQAVRRKIVFVESLLEQDEEGYFTRIWFLRSPTKCGPYSNIPYAAEVRQKIIDMYTNKMVYTNVTPSDFGFTLKDATMLKIKDTFIPAVKRAIIESTNETLYGLKVHYFQEFMGKFNATGAEKVAAVLELEQHFESLRQSRRSITDYKKGAAEKVLVIARALGNRYVDQGFVNQTDLREKCLAFSGFGDAVDGVVAQSDAKTFSGLREIFEVFLRDITQFHSDITLDLLRGALPETRSMIDDNLKNVMLAMYEGYMIWFNQTLSTDPVGALKSFTLKYKNLEQFYQALNESSGAAVASTGLEYLHTRVFPDVNYPSIAQGIANIKILEGQLSKLVKDGIPI